MIKTLGGNEAEQLRIKIRAEIARRAALKGDILEWGKACFPEKFSLPFCGKMHGHFINIRNHPFTNTEAPRGHAKTTIKCFLIPIFQALNEYAPPRQSSKYPWKVFRHYLNVQSTEAKALSVNRAIMSELESNPVLRDLYGDQVSKTKWTNNQFCLNNGVVFTAIGAGQSVRGINYLNVRPDYIIVDDLYDEDDINNTESTGKKNTWFWGSLYPCRAESKDSSIHVQGTAINAEDLMEKLKEHTYVTSATFQSVLNWDTKEVLWPELYTFDKLQRDHALLGSLIFYREMQNERRDDKTSIIKRAWLENWEYDPLAMKLGADIPVLSVMLCCDPSIGRKVENDPTAMCMIYRVRLPGERLDTFFITQLFQDHLSLDQRVKKLQSMSIGPGGFRANKVRIEAISAFQDFTQKVKDDTSLPVEEITNVKDKISVMEGKSAFFENHRVRISKDIPQNLRDTLVYQLTTNHPKNDDLRDTVFLGLDANDLNLDWI